MICSQCNKEVGSLNYCLIGSKVILNKNTGLYERVNLKGEVCYNCRRKHNFQIIEYPKTFKF